MKVLVLGDRMLYGGTNIIWRIILVRALFFSVYWYGFNVNK